MFNRYWQIGIIAASVVLIAAALITAKTDSGKPQADGAVIELSAKDVVPSPAPENTNTGPSLANYSKAELVVQGMSCSGCINEIKSSLAKFDGIGEVLVDLSGGRVEVYYDDTKLKEIDQIASAITSVGYPAALTRTLSKAEIQKENSLYASKSKIYIAAVGGWEIARSDFDIEMNHARTRYEQIYGKEVFNGEKGATLIQRLKAQVASRLITEGIQLQEIQKAGFKLSDQKVQSEFESFLSQKGMTRQAFIGMLEESGYDYEYFINKFENQVRIKRYVDEKVFSGVSNDVEKQQLYSDWFNNARLLARVVYYDRQLESAVKSNSGGSSCGNSCSTNKKS